VAHTRRRRQTKHRGNAAGVVEARGRTGRRPTAGEKAGGQKGAALAGEKRVPRYDRPPTWRGAFYRALAAAVLMLGVALLLTRNPAQAIALFPLVLLIYVPISYYTDQWMYRRRQRSKASKAGEGRALSR
jgi:hypothetical protein